MDENENLKLTKIILNDIFLRKLNMSYDEVFNKEKEKFEIDLEVLEKEQKKDYSHQRQITIENLKRRLKEIKEMLKS